MLHTFPREMNLAVGKLYRFGTKAQVDDVLLYQGPRPLAVGDLGYCEHKIGNAGFQFCLVKPCAGGQLRRVTGSRFAVDFTLPQVGELSEDDREQFMAGQAVPFETRSLQQVESDDPQARLRYVEPGDVIQLAEGGVSPRYAFVLGKTGERNPRLRLATTGDDGRMARVSSLISELVGAAVFADASIDKFEEGPLYVLEALQPGTILRFAEPPSMTVIGDHQEKGGQYVLLERITGHRKPEGATFHLRVRSPSGELVKQLANRWFLEKQGLAVVGNGYGTLKRS